MSYSIDNLFSLCGKRIIVAGASRGIGFELATAISDLGAEVVGLGRKKNELMQHANFEYIECDIENIDKFENVCRKLTSNGLKNLDVLINCAGITSGESVSDSLENFKSIISLNLIATYACCNAASRYMGKHDSSSIINITSIGSIQGFPDNPGYVASKGGVRMLTKALALDYAKKNIRVNSLVPGYVHTDMTDKSFQDPVKKLARSSRTILNRWGEPSDIVGGVVFLASKSAKYVTGIDLVVDGGWLSKGL